MMTADLSGVNGALGEIESHIDTVQQHLEAAEKSGLPEWRMDQISEHLKEISEYAKLALDEAEAIERDTELDLDDDEEED